MVHREIDGGQTVGADYSKILSLILIGIFVATITAFTLVLFGGGGNEPSVELEVKDEETTEQAGAEEIAEITEVEAQKQINFQPLIDSWVSSVGGKKSVLIYDIERGELAGSYNVEENYNMASLYKLFVVYEGYRRIESGVWTTEMEVPGTGYNMIECLDLAVRESYSPCAETVMSMIGRDELSRIIEEDFNVRDSDVMSLISNAQDILKIMLLFYEHPDFKREDLVVRMKDSFLNQPVTTYDWRQGLPTGFKVANVYNKVGWSYNPDRRRWDIYHDAAIVEFPEDERHFVVIVMTGDVDFMAIREFGASMEQYYLEYR